MALEIYKEGTYYYPWRCLWAAVVLGGGATTTRTWTKGAGKPEGTDPAPIASTRERNASAGARAGPLLQQG